MARFNSSLISNTITGTTSVGSPFNGSFTALTGTAPYTVTLANPTLFPGINQQFYNGTGGTVTLSTPAGNFVGAGGSAASTFPVYAGNVVSVTADGTNYIVISEDGSALTATSATISGVLTVQSSGGVAIAPSTTGTIDNVNVGATTRGSGSFNTLTANNAVTFTANTASTTTGTGTVVITGGLGVSGTINATSVSASLTGTIQTAAQANITSVGALTSLGVGASPLANTKLTVTASSGSLATFQQTGATGYGLTVIPGADTSYDAFTINNAANTLNQIRMFGNGNAIFAGTITAGKLDITNNSTYAITISGTGLIQDAPSGNNDHIATDRVRIGYMRGTNIGTIASNSADSGLSLVTHSSSTGWKESVRIQPSGNVGIGSTSPLAKLDIHGNTDTYDGMSKIYLTDLSSHASSRNWSLGNGGSAYGNLTFAVSAAKSGNAGNGTSVNVMVMQPNGNVGIGTIAPAYRLDVVAGDSGTGQMALANFRTGSSVASYNAGLQIYATGSPTATSRSVLAVWDADGADASSGDYFIISKNGNNGAADFLQYSNAAIRFGANYVGRGTYDMTITSAGNVLVGTTANLNGTNVQFSTGSGASSTPYAAVFNTATSPTSAASTRIDLGFLSGASNYVATGTVLGYLNFMGQSADDGYGGAFINSTVTSGGNVGRASGHSVDMIFGTKPNNSTGASERMRITSAGNVGIGPTTPTEKLQISGVSSGSGAHGPRINILYTGTSGGAESLVNFLDFRGVTNAAIGNNLQDDGVGTASAHLVFKTAISGTLSQRMRIFGNGIVRIGTGYDASTINEPGIVNVGAISNRDGRYVIGWWVGYTGGGTTYRHIKTSLWGGGSPYGNSDYIMGGFHIMGYYYSTPGQCDQWITFHNWSGSTQNGYNRSNAGNWTPDNTAYVGADGYVYIRLVSAGYMAYHIDLHQFPIYPVRNITVVSVTDSNASTI